MLSFLAICVLSALVIAFTSLITYEILGWVWNTLPGLPVSRRLRVLLIIVPIFAAHIVSIWIYAGVYFVVENFTGIGHLTGSIDPASLSYASFIERLYFSASTYASLGLGDIVPSDNLRMLTSAEVLNGLVMIGWTVSFTYLTMEKFWTSPEKSADAASTTISSAPLVTPAIPRNVIPLPGIKEKPFTHHYERWLRKQVHGMQPLKVAVVHPADSLSLAGAIEAAQAGMIEPLLIGPEYKIRKAADEAHIDLAPYTIIDTPHSHAAAEKAVELANRGQVEALMKGKLHTDELMEAVIEKEKGLRTGRRMSHVFMLDVPSYRKPLFLTDAAINIRPTLMEKKDIVQNAIDLFRALKLGEPKVALLSAVETVTEKLPSTIDATALCKMAERGQITGGLVDGPLAFDNAISRESAAIKDIHSAVAGDADILVVPDIESGNMLYKQLRYFSGAQGAGIVLGAKVPIILTSRSGDAENRVASCALAQLYLRGRL